MIDECRTVKWEMCTSVASITHSSVQQIMTLVIKQHEGPYCMYFMWCQGWLLFKLGEGLAVNLLRRILTVWDLDFGTVKSTENKAFYQLTVI